MTTLYRYEGDATFRPVNGGPDLVVDPLGTPGNRPALSVKPDATNTGRRVSTTQTLTGPDALAAVLAAPVEADGYRYLRRALITSQVTFDDPVVHSALRFEDCEFTDAGNYRVDGNYATGSPPAVFPEFRWCTITGGATSTIQGCGVRYLRCNISRGVDTVKARGTGGEFYACYIHDQFRAIDAHCDGFQIRSNAVGLVVHWCNVRSFHALDSEELPGSRGNGCLQTGTVTADIGPVYWYNNWFDGGQYSIRVGQAIDGLGTYSRTYVFQGNKFGPNYNFGPVLGLGEVPGVTWDNTNVWEDTGLPVV